MFACLWVCLCVLMCAGQSICVSGCVSCRQPFLRHTHTFTQILFLLILLITKVGSSAPLLLHLNISLSRIPPPFLSCPSSQARKECESSKLLVREKETTVQSLLSQLGFSQEEGKRVKHQNMLMECSAAHTRLQRRFPAHATASDVGAGLTVGGSGGVGDGEIVGGITDFFESGLPLCATAANNFYTVLEGHDPPPFHVSAGSADGVCGTNPFTSDLDAKKNTYSKYSVESALLSQSDTDRMRQELHRERTGRAKERHALSLSLEEAVARASFAESMAEDRR